MYTVRFLLKTTAYDEKVLEKRFRAAAHIHNVLVSHAKKLLRKLEHNGEYQSCRETYAALLKKGNLTKEEVYQKKQLSGRMDAVRRDIGLTEYSFQSYIKVCGKQFRKCLSSQQIQKEATRVWKGVKKVLFSDGRDIHFKKYCQFHTICGKSNSNGVKFHKEDHSIEWMGLSIFCKICEGQMAALDHDISYCEVERKMFPNGWHYYVNIYLKGDAPRRLAKTGEPGSLTGIDMGVSTVAAISDHAAMLEELAPRCPEYNKKIKKLLRHMDFSKRASNPKKYKADGTIDKGNHDRWIYSNTYKKDMRKLQSLYRQKAAYIKQSHEEQANRLLAESVDFVTEEMSFKGLQRRAKKAGRSDILSVLRGKDGTVKNIRKYKRRRRFGRSLNNRAPSQFLTILERKAVLYGGSFVKVRTSTFRASQYDHVSDTYEKIPLAQRNKMIGEKKVQRDLYSAFLLKNTGSSLKYPDRDKCIRKFGKFLTIQDSLIENMKARQITMKQCFGF